MLTHDIPILMLTSEGSVDVHIELIARSAQPSRPILQIIVNDTGIGISREQSEQLFQPFMQADNRDVVGRSDETALGRCHAGT